MNEITLQPGESVTIRAASAGTPPVEPPVEPPYVPPVEPPYVPPVQPPATGGVFLGNLQFDGGPVYTGDLPPGVQGNQWCYVGFVIPHGQDGKTINISYAQHVDPQYSRIVTFTQAPGDFSAQWPQRAEGASGGINLSIGTPRGNCLTVYPGQSWAFNAKCTKPQSGSANFLITPGVPTT